MFLNPLHGAVRGMTLIAGLAGTLALSGCSSFRSEARDAPAPAATSVISASAEPEAPQQTVTEALGDLPEADESATTVVENVGPALNPSAPRSYVVQRGDTLWGLARMFLRDPWLWPEIWFVNPQVQNPHLIYPGDTLALATGSNGQPQLQLTRGPGARLQPMLRSSSLGDNGPIATIPYEAIRAFLSRPGVLTKDEVKQAPYVLAIRDDHLIAGADHDLYVKQLKDGGVGARYSVMHVDAPLRDPENGDRLGNMAVYAGTAAVTRVGDTATVRVTESAREILRGDVLMPETALDIGNIVPRAPTARINGQVMAVVNGVLLVGQYQIVAINRGADDGLEVGHVLKALEAGESVRDHCARINGSGTCVKWRSEKLPDEIAGTLLVFKTHPQLSYALVVGETSPIHIGDHIVNP
jgi:LysM repeat protein